MNQVLALLNDANMLFHKLDKHRDIGLLILRIGIGSMFVWHGYAKLSAGPERWIELGQALLALGINFAPKFMGLVASISEFGGGMLLILGLLTRPACFFLLITMVVATSMHLANGDPRQILSHPLELAILFLSLLLIGPGRFSMDEMLLRNRERRLPKQA